MVVGEYECSVRGRAGSQGRTNVKEEENKAKGLDAIKRILRDTKEEYKVIRSQEPQVSVKLEYK